MSTIYYRNYRLNTTDRATFAGGIAHRVVLKPGDWLYRVVTPVTKSFRGNYIHGGFWFGGDTYLHIMKMMDKRKASFSEVARSVLAIKENWNPGMCNLCQITMTKTAFAWQGKTRHQSRNDGDRRLILMGGSEQLFIPVVKPELEDDNGNIALSKISRLSFYGSVPD